MTDSGRATMLNNIKWRDRSMIDNNKQRNTCQKAKSPQNNKIANRREQNRYKKARVLEKKPNRREQKQKYQYLYKKLLI
jgi:hypothetical protein